jgi:hypothetical protein
MMMEWLYKTFVDPEKIGPAWYAWVGGSILSLWFIFWWSIGMFPTPAFGEGFARAEQVDRLEARYIENEVIDAVERRCTAQTPQSRRYFSERITEKLDDYRKLTGTKIVLPTCRDLGIDE